MDLSEYPVVITLNVVGIRVKQRWAQTYERDPTLDPTPTNARGAVHSALCCLAVRTAFAGTFTTLILEFLHGEYHARGRGCVHVVYHLHAPPQVESGDRALNAFSTGGSRGWKGDADVCAWPCGCGSGGWYRRRKGGDGMGSGGAIVSCA